MKVIIVSGISGVGKSTLVKQFIKEGEGKYELVRSMTTRSPRDSDDYYTYVSRMEFVRLLEQGAFLETKLYQGSKEFYGTPKQEIERIVTEGKTPIAIINANEQEYDTKTNVMTARGTVSIKYRDVTAFSDKAIVRTNKNGDVQRLDLVGHAKINQTKHHATADHFIYTSSNEEMVAIGNTMTSTVTDNGSPFKVTARYQQYDKKNNIFMGSGNVQVYYQDYYAKAPKMTCYPDKITQKINEVFMTGRSMIQQNDKEIHADKIKIIVDPKNFEAVGSVKTIIKDLGNQDNGKDGGFL